MLLGRERERQALEAVLANARGGRSSVLALVGEAGIGKTSLLEYAQEQAAGLTVLRARGVEAEAHVPFAGLFALLRPVLPLLERLPRTQAAALESALALRPSAAGERFAVAAATLGLLGLFAEQAPVLVLIDDAHLLDPGTADAVRFALRRLLAEPIGAILAARSGEPSLLDGTDLPVLAVSGLDPESAAQLLGPVVPEVASRLYRATAGNPLALRELAQEAQRLAPSAIETPIPLPARVSQAFVARAGALSTDARKVLLLAATDGAGDLATVERAALAGGLDVSELSAAEDAGLVRLGPDSVEFVHPLARSAVYNDAPVVQRRAAHRAIAHALADRDADRRAWHLAEATVGADDSVSSALEQAAARARARSAYAIAAAAYERSARLARGELRRARLLLAAAEAAWLGGLADGAVALLEAARAGIDDDPLLVEINALRGHIATHRGPVMRGHAILVETAEGVAETSPEAAIGLLADAVDASFYAGHVREMSLAADRAVELLTDGASPRTRFLATMSKGMSDVFAGEARNGIAAIRAANAIAEADDSVRNDTSLFSWLTMGPLWLREAGEGRALVAHAMDTARAQAALGHLPWLLSRVARDDAASDSWARAGVEYDEAIRLARETGQATDLAAALAGLAALEARQGREAECRSHAAEAGELCAALGIDLIGVWTVRALSDLELGLGRPAAAMVHLEDCARRLSDLGIRDADLSPAPEMVDAYLRLGRREEAVAVAAGFDTDAQAKGQPWTLARAARSRALVTDDGRFDASFQEAVALHARSPDVFELGVTRLAYGGRLRRTGQRRRAREQLRGALEIFDRLGADPWRETTRVELLATGETARGRGVSAIDTLTRQELHIAQVLAAGSTTRQAAASLFLSPKTVEYHLRSVYAKLGVNSRAELAEVVETEG